MKIYITLRVEYFAVHPYFEGMNLAIIWVILGCFIFLIILILIISNASIFFNEKSRPLPIDETKPFTNKANEIKIKKGNSKAILFVHGYPSSPATYIYIANQASENGYDVFVPRLPGFATDINSFIKTRFTDWYDYLSNYYSTLRADYKDFYIVGTSLGGALTLKLAQEYSEKKLAPTAIVTIAAPVFINKISKGIIKEPLAFVLKPVSLFKPSIKPKQRKATNDNKDGMENWVGYQGIFPKQAHSVIMNLRIIKKKLYKIKVPIYLLHDRKDKTVPFINMEYISKKVKSTSILSEAVDLEGLESNRHCLLLYNSIKDELFVKINNFFISNNSDI